jgi:hypothetical protein
MATPDSPSFYQTESSESLQLLNNSLPDFISRFGGNRPKGAAEILNIPEGFVIDTHPPVDISRVKNDVVFWKVGSGYSNKELRAESHWEAEVRRIGLNVVFASILVDRNRYPTERTANIHNNTGWRVGHIHPKDLTIDSQELLNSLSVDISNNDAIGLRSRKLDALLATTPFKDQGLLPSWDEVFNPTLRK